MRLVPSFTDRVKSVGQAVKSLFVPSGVSTDLSYTRGGASGLSSFVQFGESGDTRYFSFSGNTSCVNAYNRCAPYAAVINRKTAAHLNGINWILDKGGKKNGKESETAVAKKIRALMIQPNPLQSWSEFEAQAYLYKQVFGYCVILSIKPVGFGNHDAKALYVLPPWCCEVFESEEPYAMSSTRKAIARVEFQYGRQRTVITENFFVLKDFTPSMQTLALPQSRVFALEHPINNCMGAMESRNVLINYRGAMGILSNENADASGSVALTPREKEEVQADLRQYGLRNTQMQFIITSAKLKWQSMSQPTKDLMLIEEVKDSMQQICDAYGYPYRLLSANDVNSLGGSDLKEYKKAFYQDTIIPEAKDFYEQWGRFFELEKYNLYFDKDYSHLPVLQEDSLQQAQARKELNTALEIEFRNGLITLDEWRIKLGEDPLPDGIGDFRATDRNKGDVPLATVIGVGGVQALIEVLTAQGMSEEARRNTVEIVFGISAEQAERMVVNSSQSSGNPEPLNTSNGSQSTQQQPEAEPESAAAA